MPHVGWWLCVFWRVWWVVRAGNIFIQRVVCCRCIKPFTRKCHEEYGHRIAWWGCQQEVSNNYSSSSNNNNKGECTDEFYFAACQEKQDSLPVSKSVNMEGKVLMMLVLMMILRPGPASCCCELVERPLTLHHGMKGMSKGRRNGVGLPVVDAPFHSAGYMQLNNTVDAKLFYFYFQVGLDFWCHA